MKNLEAAQTILILFGTIDRLPITRCGVAAKEPYGIVHHRYDSMCTLLVCRQASSAHNLNLNGVS